MMAQSTDKKKEQSAWRFPLSGSLRALAADFRGERAYGVYQILREFKDEDKWFKYFTKKQALVVLSCLLTILLAGSAAKLLVTIGIMGVVFSIPFWLGIIKMISDLLV